MEQFLAALNGAWRVLLLGLLFGAGLPMLFAFGVRALAWGTGSDSGRHKEGDVLPEPSLIGRLIAYMMFAIVIMLVLAGVGYIVGHGLGWTITFTPWPVVTPT